MQQNLTLGTQLTNSYQTAIAQPLKSTTKSTSSKPLHDTTITITLTKDILKDQWSPALTIKTALLSLQALLCAPEPTDPQDAQVAKMYMRDKAEFDKTAKFWTEMYASTKMNGKKEECISRVCEMGFDRGSAEKALVKHSWDESAAVNELLGGM
mmetsp:Transcript_27536/g.56657  ORF Transcript_27536/g.56657 Transcript_27536/m.56657 type:complete len:154 (+) Transcript_27536:165-626(+)